MPHLFSRGKSRAPCSSAGRTTTHLLLSLLALAPFSASVSAASSDHASEQLVIPLPPPLTPEPPAPANHVFTLRHIYHHGTHLHPSLHRRKDYQDREAAVFLAKEDGDDGDGNDRLPPLQALSHGAPIQRLVDRRPSVVDPMVALARERGYVTVLSPDAWTIDSVVAPNVTDKATIVSLAYMASNAYVATPDEPDWDDVGAPFNRSADFGWEGDGLRGHVFADATNSTIVIGLKGTSTAVFDGEGTTTNDKENDNLFFGCCCGQQGQWTYRQVCSCATGTYACNNTCVRQALRDENRYYMAARELYTNVTELYPDATVWLTGHSLGGAVASFVGLTYGHPVVTFQAVPEAMAVARLGLPVPPGADPDYPQTRAHTGTYHVGHTADPIYMGICNGASAACSYAGYALESSCHSGYECVYDVVADKGWRVGVGTHRIRSVIRDVLLSYDEVPVCNATPECRDCARWHMYESNGTEPVSSTTTATTAPPTSTSTTKTRTRTQTCQTPGWWGCLDTTTTGTATTTTSETTTTSSCKTPGWWGCLDKTTTTTTEAATTTTSTTSTGTCETPGRFWGCRDDPTNAVSSSSTLPSSRTTARTLPAMPTNTGLPTSTTAATSTTSSCLTPGRIWGCWDEPKTASTTAALSTITPPPAAPTAPASTEPTTSTSRCRRRSWFGVCKEWGAMDEL